MHAPVSPAVSIRLVTHLNALLHGSISLEVAARSVVDADVAHHVLDPDGRAGLDPLRSSELEPALGALGALEHEGWVLALPSPGRLGPLRGPAAFNQAAIEAHEAVIGRTGGVGLVPHRVGPAVQWQVFAASPPGPPPTPYEAERVLSETVLEVTRALHGLDVAAGERPDVDLDVRLAAGYPPRQRLMADRALRLMTVCDHALAGTGGAISSHEIDSRQRHLALLRTAASDALSAACSWPVEMS